MSQNSENIEIIDLQERLSNALKELLETEGYQELVQELKNQINRSVKIAEDLRVNPQSEDYYVVTKHFDENEIYRQFHSKKEQAQKSGTLQEA